MNIFEIMGPIMVGPSSSHTAGAARMGYVARKLLGFQAGRADIALAGSFAATAAEREKLRSVELTSPVRKGMTPQQMESCRRVFSCMVSAATGQAGRHRQIIRAVRPELLAARIAVAFKSRAVRQQVWVMASLMLLEIVTTSCFWKRFQ